MLHGDACNVTAGKVARRFRCDSRYRETEFLYNRDIAESQLSSRASSAVWHYDGIIKTSQVPKHIIVA